MRIKKMLKPNLVMVSLDFENRKRYNMWAFYEDDEYMTCERMKYKSSLMMLLDFVIMKFYLSGVSI